MKFRQHFEWILCIVAFESAGVPLPERQSLLPLHSLPPPLVRSTSLSLYSSCSGCDCRGRYGIHGRASAWLPFLRRYGRYIRLDEDRLMIGRYLFFSMGTPSCSLGVSLQCYECLRLGLQAPIACRRVVFLLQYNWRSLLGVSLRLRCLCSGRRNLQDFRNTECDLIWPIYCRGYALSIFIRRNEVTLRRRARHLSDHSCG